MEKLLIKSNFSISNSVFKRLIQQTRRNLVLLGKGFIMPLNSPLIKFQQIVFNQTLTSCHDIHSERKLFKTMQEKVKMLLTTIFSFSYYVFLPFQNKFPILSHIFFPTVNAMNLNNFAFLSMLSFGKELTFPKQALVFTCLLYKPFENTVGKGEIARYAQFLLFPVFSTCLEIFLPFSSNLKLSSADALNLEE